MVVLLKAGDCCSICGTELVELAHETLQESIRTFKPNIKSIPPSVLREHRDSYAICPQCDAYALGSEMTNGFPFRDKHGRIRTIHELL